MIPLRGLMRLTWLEIKIFLREPMGAVGTIAVPVIVFIVFARLSSRAATAGPANGLMRSDLPVFIAVFIALSAVLSLVTVLSVYREGGILKRLRATPLRPYTILTAHVIVKLLLSALTLFMMVLAGRRLYLMPPGVSVVASRWR
jgi:ABC-2 type transport system permease protein